jgi:hypothetical protein
MPAPSEVETHEIAPHILELRDHYLEYVLASGIQHEILADGYITDA